MKAFKKEGLFVRNPPNPKHQNTNPKTPKIQSPSGHLRSTFHVIRLLGCLAPRKPKYQLPGIPRGYGQNGSVQHRCRYMIRARVGLGKILEYGHKGPGDHFTMLEHGVQIYGSPPRAPKRCKAVQLHLGDA